VTFTDLGAAALGVLLLVAVFGIFAADGHYGQVTLFITIALILTLELLGVSSPETLFVRMALTALGAALGVIVALSAGFWGARRRHRSA
jgi:uncharacterized membrane protein YccC